MRRADAYTESLFTIRKLDEFVPAEHLLCPIRQMVNEVLKEIEPLLSGMYAVAVRGGSQHCPEEAPARHAAANFYSIRSERQLMEQN